MSNPTHEGADAFTNTAVSSLTFSVTTAANNDIVSLWLSAEKPSATPTVSSVTSAGLTPIKRKAITQASVQSDLGATTGVNLEHWYIAVPTASTISITVNWSTTCDAVGAIAIRLSGVYSLSDPCDSNASFPSTDESQSSIPPALTFSTDQPLSFVLYGVACPRLGTFGTGPSFATNADNLGGAVSGASSYLQSQIAYHAYTTTQSSVSTGQWGGGFFTMAGVSLDDAFTASPKGFKFQTFVSFCSSG